MAVIRQRFVITVPLLFLTLLNFEKSLANGSGSFMNTMTSDGWRPIVSSPEYKYQQSNVNNNVANVQDNQQYTKQANRVESTHQQQSNGKTHADRVNSQSESFYQNSPPKNTGNKAELQHQQQQQHAQHQHQQQQNQQQQYHKQQQQQHESMYQQNNNNKNKNNNVRQTNSNKHATNNQEKSQHVPPKNQNQKNVQYYIPQNTIKNSTPQTKPKRNKPSMMVMRPMRHKLNSPMLIPSNSKREEIYVPVPPSHSHFPFFPSGGGVKIQPPIFAPPTAVMANPFYSHHQEYSKLLVPPPQKYIPIPQIPLSKYKPEKPAFIIDGDKPSLSFIHQSKPGIVLHGEKPPTFKFIEDKNPFNNVGIVSSQILISPSEKPTTKITEPSYITLQTSKPNLAAFQNNKHNQFHQITTHGNLFQLDNPAKNQQQNQIKPSVELEITKEHFNVFHNQVPISYGTFYDSNGSYEVTEPRYENEPTERPTGFLPTPYHDKHLEDIVIPTADLPSSVFFNQHDLLPQTQLATPVKSYNNVNFNEHEHAPEIHTVDPNHWFETHPTAPTNPETTPEPTTTSTTSRPHRGNPHRRRRPTRPSPARQQETQSNVATSSQEKPQQRRRKKPVIRHNLNNYHTQATTQATVEEDVTRHVFHDQHNYGEQFEQQHEVTTQESLRYENPSRKRIPQHNTFQEQQNYEEQLAQQQDVTTQESVRIEQPNRKRIRPRPTHDEHVRSRYNKLERNKERGREDEENAESMYAGQTDNRFRFQPRPTESLEDNRKYEIRESETKRNQINDEVEEEKEREREREKDREREEEMEREREAEREETNYESEKYEYQPERNQFKPRPVETSEDEHVYEETENKRYKSVNEYGSNEEKYQNVFDRNRYRSRPTEVEEKEETYETEEKENYPPKIENVEVEDEIKYQEENTFTRSKPTYHEEPVRHYQETTTEKPNVLNTESYTNVPPRFEVKQNHEEQPKEEQIYTKQPIENEIEDAPQTTTVAPVETTQRNRLHRPRFSVKDYRQRLQQSNRVRLPPLKLEESKTNENGARQKFVPKETRHRTVTETPPRTKTDNQNQSTSTTEKPPSFNRNRLRAGIGKYYNRYRTSTTEPTVLPSPRVPIKPNPSLKRFTTSTEPSVDETVNIDENAELEISRVRQKTNLNVRDEPEPSKNIMNLRRRPDESNTAEKSKTVMNLRRRPFTTRKPDFTSSDSFSDEGNNLEVAESQVGIEALLSDQDAAKRVAELTQSATGDDSNLFHTLGQTKSVSPGYFTISTDNPILPIEAFFTHLRD